MSALPTAIASQVSCIGHAVEKSVDPVLTQLSGGGRA